MQPTEFRVGRVLGGGLQIWKDNFLLIMGLTLLIHLPVVFYTVALLNQGYLEANSETWLDLAIFVCGLLTVIGVTYVTVTSRRGQAPTFPGALRAMAGRFFPVLWAMLVFLLVVAGIGMIAFILAQILAELGVVIGLVLGVVLLLNYWVFVPVAVIEGPGAIGSLNRSKDLALGQKGRIFAIALVYLGFFKALEFATGFLWASTAWFDLSWLLTSGLVLGVLESSVSAAIVAVGYVELRAVHDGSSVDELAAVFE